MPLAVSVLNNSCGDINCKRSLDADSLAEDMQLLSQMHSNDAEAHAHFEARGGRR
jgi:hypothetical protein